MPFKHEVAGSSPAWGVDYGRVFNKGQVAQGMSDGALKQRVGRWFESIPVPHASGVYIWGLWPRPGEYPENGILNRSHLDGAQSIKMSKQVRDLSVGCKARIESSDGDNYYSVF